MTTSLETGFNPTPVILLALCLGLFLWEAVRPGRPLPRVRGWKIRGLVALIGFFALSIVLPLFWKAFLARYQLLDLGGLGTLWGTVAGLLVYQLGVYLWHRAIHQSDTLWRVFHQMHQT